LPKPTGSFYEEIGAKQMKQWQTLRLEGGELLLLGKGA
jgi:hypothetical protein